ncbi:MAG: TrmH family RNA methyltransferase [Thermodesulfobacteriota bacterium]
MITPSKRTASQLKPLTWYKKLATKKGRVEAGAFLVEGKRSIDQIAAAYPDQLLEIITTTKLPSSVRAYPARYITESQFRSISAAKTPQGIMGLIRLPHNFYSHRLPQHRGSKVLLLEDIQDPGNVGTLIRTAGAFDFSGIILTDRCADPLSPKCVQSSAGSILSVWMRRTSQYVELTKTLKEQGFTIIAAELSGKQDLSMLTRCSKLLLCLGNETSGISKKLTDMAHYRVRIPIEQEKAESLNVAISGAILMYLSSPNLGENGSVYGREKSPC